MKTFIFTAIFLMSTVNVYAARNGDKLIGWPGSTLDGRTCFGRLQAFGPFDYTDKTYSIPGLYTEHGSSQESPLRFVEKAHFTHNVEMLIKGRTGVLPTDIDYTIRAFPNHHRALWAMIKFELMFLKKGAGRNAIIQITKPYNPTKIPPPECYLNRAIKFDPEDPVLYMLYGLDLHKRGLLTYALKYYKESERVYKESDGSVKENAELYYDMGLLYVDMKNYKEAKKYAKKAYILHYPLMGLKKALDDHNKK